MSRFRRLLTLNVSVTTVLFWTQTRSSKPRAWSAGALQARSARPGAVPVEVLQPSDLPEELRGIKNPKVRDRIKREVELKNEARDKLDNVANDGAPGEQLVAAALVVQRDVVRCVELALRVVVDVDVNAIGDDAARLHVELEVHLRLERADAIREGREQIGGAASLVAVALDLGLDA